MPRNSFVELVDNLLLEKGEQKGKYWCASVTSSEVIQTLNQVEQNATHRNIKVLVNMHYPDTRFEPIGINAASGWKFHIRIRTK